MARAAERHRRTPNRPSPASLRATSLSSPNLSKPPPITTGSSSSSSSSSYLKPPINTKSTSNGYSMGSSLPSGVSWRYVDVLNQDR